MASSSSSTNSKWSYDVFISFRGEDTRKNFVDHLYTALVDGGIHTFKDDEKLKRGESVSTELPKAIEESRFAIVVFSKNYADSSWCLNELVKIMDCRNSIGQKVLPVFYDVDPSDVRKQKGCFGEAFGKLQLNGGKDKNQIQGWRYALREAFCKLQLNGGNDQNQIQRWRDALAEAASISGWSLKDAANGHESKCIKQIVEEIFINLRDSRASSFSKKLIGFESRVRNVKSLLQTSPDEVQMLGIWGMGGSGKTTLARAIFDDISHEFEGRSFVANVRETSKSGGLPSLQEQILCDILMQSNKVRNIYDGKSMMSRLCHKRVILVLDDVDDEEQLEALAGDRDWFGKGSKIIITTRDEHVLVAHGVDKIHKVVLLNDDESVLLFNMWAFRGNNPPDEFVEISRQVRRMVDGHPLALKVLGSSLCGRDFNQWESILQRLKDEPQRKIFKVLKISYDNLEKTEQQIFLDIACFFRGVRKDKASLRLDSCDFHPEIGLKILVEKCLIDISPDGLLQMHDLMMELALNIVNPHNSGRYSRLWNNEHICDVLRNDTGMEQIEGIQWQPGSDKRKINSFRGLKNMKKLRFLELWFNGPMELSEEDGPEYLSHELRWLFWYYYPFQSLPQSFQPEKLVYLVMQYSKMDQLWNGKKAMGKLKYVDLNNSCSLIKTPDFSGAPNLEELSLCGCVNLKEVHSSLGDLQSLTKLDLDGCTSLESFTFDFNMTSLELLNLSYCQKLRVFPQIHGDMKRLTHFNLEDTAIEEVHPSIEKLTGLVHLDLTSCRNLRCLPSTIGHLKCLKTLRLAGSPMLEELPDTFGQMESLEQLDINGSVLRLHFPALSLTMKNLKHLTIFGGLEYIYSMGLLYPPSLSIFQHIKILRLISCSLLRFPSNLSEMPALEYLDLTGNDFTDLPNNLSQYTQLKILVLRNCENLKALAKLPQGIAVLIMDDCKSLESHGDMLTEKYKWLRLVSFGICLNYLNSQDKSSSSGLAAMWLQTLLQGRAFVNYEFSILIPGIEIPDFFLQHDVNKDYPQLRHRPDWKRIIVGFIVCVSFVHNIEEKVSIYLGDECSCRYFFINCFNKTLISDHHIWMGYISLELLGQKLFGDGYKNQYDLIGGTKECDLTVRAPNLKGRIKKLGIHVAYADSIEPIEDEQDPDVYAQQYYRNNWCFKF